MIIAHTIDFAENVENAFMINIRKVKKSPNSVGDAILRPDKIFIITELRDAKIASPTGNGLFGEGSFIRSVYSKAIKTCSQATRNISEATRNVSRAMRKVSEATRNVSRTMRKVSEATRNVFRAMRKVSEATRNVSGVMRNISEATRNVSRVTGNDRNSNFNKQKLKYIGE